MHRRSVLATAAVLPALFNSDWAPLPQPAGGSGRLVPPAHGDINVAVLLSDGATIIDFCGPWEVFQDVVVDGSYTSPGARSAFRLYTVAERRDPITASAGMRIVPDFTIDDAPPPRVVVIPAQRSRSPRVLDWVRKSHSTADVTLSVCTGAFLLAATGLLAGKAATTHHDFYERFASTYPDVELRRRLRYVEQGKLMTAGGLTSGIDAALRIVERYFGRDTAQRTATYMEYQGRGWIDNARA